MKTIQIEITEKLLKEYSTVIQQLEMYEGTPWLVGEAAKTAFIMNLGAKVFEELERQL